MPEAATSPTATAVAATTAVSPTAAVAAKPGATLEPTTLPTVHTTHPTTDVGSSKNLKDVKVAAMPEASPGGVKPFREYLLEALGSPGVSSPMVGTPVSAGQRPPLAQLVDNGANKGEQLEECLC